MRYSQLIIMVSMACEEPEKCSSVCIVLPTEEALLVPKQQSNGTSFPIPDTSAATQRSSQRGD